MATKKFTKEEALKFIQNFKGYPKYLTGSTKLKFSNPHDLDYVIIVDDATALKFNLSYESIHIDNRLENKPNLDYFVFSETALKNVLTFNDPDYSHYKYIAVYLLDKGLSPELPFEYHVLDYKDKVKQVLKIRFLDFMSKFERKIPAHKKYNIAMPKELYNLAYLLFCILDNSIFISKEHFKICEKIHDKKMPVTYLDTLKELIDTL